MTEQLIDPGAPVVAESELEIEAGPEAVWDVLTDVERWPTWNPDVKSASLQGAVTEGSTFRWKAGPGTIKSTIRHVERPSVIAWTGSTFGIKANHVYFLEGRGTTTLVKTSESYDGLVARVFRRQLKKTLDRALVDGLRCLKAELETRAGDGHPPQRGGEADDRQEREREGEGDGDHHSAPVPKTTP
jgi:carbon monoxide dehydrogenase subunit G